MRHEEGRRDRQDRERGSFRRRRRGGEHQADAEEQARDAKKRARPKDRSCRRGVAEAGGREEGGDERAADGDPERSGAAAVVGDGRESEVMGRDAKEAEVELFKDETMRITLILKK